MANMGSEITGRLVETYSLYSAGNIGSELDADFDRGRISAVNHGWSCSRLPDCSAGTRLSSESQSRDASGGQGHGLTTRREHVASLTRGQQVVTGNQPSETEVSRGVSRDGQESRARKGDNRSETAPASDGARYAKRVARHCVEVHGILRQVIDRDGLARRRESHSRIAGSNCICAIHKTSKTVVSSRVGGRSRISGSSEGDCGAGPADTRNLTTEFEGRSIHKYDVNPVVRRDVAICWKAPRRREIPEDPVMTGYTVCECVNGRIVHALALEIA